MPVISRLVRTRNAGRALIDEAIVRGAEVIVLGSPGRDAASTRLFDETADFVVRHAPCKVVVGATERWRGEQTAAPVRQQLLEVGEEE